jgi:hypothetical protein
VTDNSNLDGDVQEDAEGVDETKTAWQVSVNCRININADVVVKWHFSSRPGKQDSVGDQADCNYQDVDQDAPEAGYTKLYRKIPWDVYRGMELP